MIGKSQIKVLLVDDHPALVDGLRKIEAVDPAFRVIATAGTSTEAVTLSLALQPDIILMDTRLTGVTGASGIDACRRIKAALPSTCVLFLSAFPDNELVLAAMEAGAEGYILKERNVPQIVEAMRAVLNGNKLFEPIRPPEKKQPANRLNLLTLQERRVLEEVAKGKTDKQVGEILGLSAKTVRNYLDRVFTKLSVHTRTAAAALYRDRLDS